MKSGSSPFGPLLAWSLPQLAVLILVANQIPWLPAKSMSRPAEVAALQLMLFVQFTTAALLLPLIFRDLLNTTFAMLLAAPMTLLASFLSGEVARWKMVYAVGYVQLWLITLACWTTILRSPRALAIGSAIALTLLFAGPVTAFVRSEYAMRVWTENSMSPFLDAMHASHEGVLTHGEIARLGGLCVVGLIVAIFTATSRPPVKQDSDSIPLPPTL